MTTINRRRDVFADADGNAGFLGRKERLEDLDVGFDAHEAMNPC